jgi:hypothetical protein
MFTATNDPVVQRDRARRRLEDQRSGLELLVRRVREVHAIQRPLGHRDVSGVPDEPAEVGIRDGMLISLNASTRSGWLGRSSG